MQCTCITYICVILLACSDLEVIQLHTIMDSTLEISDSEEKAKEGVSDSPGSEPEELTSDDFYSNLERNNSPLIHRQIRQRTRLG